MFNDLQKALMLKGVRWAGTAIGGAVAAWAFSHSNVMVYVNQACAAMSNPQAMSAGISGLAVAAAGLYFSMKDAKTVDAKLTTVAVTGDLGAANDPQIRADTVAAVKSGAIPDPRGWVPGLAEMIATHRASGGKGG